MKNDEFIPITNSKEREVREALGFVIIQCPSCGHFWQIEDVYVYHVRYYSQMILIEGGPSMRHLSAVFSRFGCPYCNYTWTQKYQPNDKVCIYLCDKK